MPDLSRTFVHKVAHARARSEMFREMRMGVDELAKALAADDAHSLPDPDVPDPDRMTECPKCGFRGPGEAVRRHQDRTGHDSGRPDRDDTNNYAHGDDRDSLNKAALVNVVASKPAMRHTLVAVTPDRFGADPQDFQDRFWKATKPPCTMALTDDDGRKLGWLCEWCQWPFPMQPSALRKSGDDFRSEVLPANSYYVGVIWEPEAWAEVQAGRLSPADTVAGALTP